MKHLRKIYEGPLAINSLFFGVVKLPECFGGRVSSGDMGTLSLVKSSTRRGNSKHLRRTSGQRR
jgi:hypothetical protein